MSPVIFILGLGCFLLVWGLFIAYIVGNQDGVLIMIGGAFLIAVATILAAFGTAHARDLGQWQASDAEIVRWYKNLMMPDAPAVSCCGEADAYWADSFEVDKASGQYVAIITDDRPDAPRHRPHRDVGTRVVIPNHKIKFNEGNPTGHGVLFISGGGAIYCYIPPGGV